MKFQFENNKTGEDAEISIFPMNLGNVIKLGEKEADEDITLLEKAYDVTKPIESYKAKLEIVLMCTDESEETLKNVFDPMTLVRCYTECMKLSGFEFATSGEKKTMNP